MRIVEPKKNVAPKDVSTKKQSSVKKLGFLFFILVVLGGVFMLVNKPLNSEPAQNIDDSSVVDQNNNDVQTEVTDTQTSDDNIPPQGTIREFTDNEFKVFYDRLLQPNLERVENPPFITGNDIADTRIRKIAESRGYRLRSSPSTILSSYQGHQLQEAVIPAWQALAEAARKDGLSMSIVSGYRSVETQRSLFTSRLAATGATVEMVANGEADDKVDFVLTTSSIPGYSKHHTGYTIDLLCAGYAFENFKNSPCNNWLSADNYKVAKENGFIPSYPPLADAQGPEPEAWEYVWVGTDLLYY